VNFYPPTNCNKALTWFIGTPISLNKYLSTSKSVLFDIVAVPQLHAVHA